MRRVAGRLAKPLCHEAEICLAQEGRRLRRPRGWRRVGRQNACRGEFLKPKARVLDALSNGQVSWASDRVVSPWNRIPCSAGDAGGVAMDLVGGASAAKLHVQGRT